MTTTFQRARALAIAACLAGCAAAPEMRIAHEPPDKPGDPLVARLLEGGYVIYIRHGRTDPSYQDKQDRPEWWKSCDPKRHRLLSDDGRAQMLSIGANLRALQIPVGKVVTSEYCRAVDSGLLLQLMPVSQDPGMNYADAQRVARRSDPEIHAALRALISEKPPPGKNTILVGHVQGINPPVDQVFVALQEAEAAIVRPLGDGKFEIVGRVPVDKWALREKK
jgi:phosphohistidine phosphatase SixA